MQHWQFIDNFNQLNMFRVIVSPILISTRLFFFYGFWYETPTMLQVGNMLPTCSIVGVLYQKL